MASRTTTEIPSPRAFAKASNSSWVAESRRTLIAADLTIGEVKRAPNGARSQIDDSGLDTEEHSGAHWFPMAHSMDKARSRRPMEKSIKVRLPTEHRDELERIAVARNLNISYLVRDAVRSLLDQHVPGRRLKS